MKLNTHNIELPDGTLVTIEGGDAESVAKQISTDYLPKLLARNSPAPTTNQPASAASPVIQPLGAPVWNFRKTEPERPAPAVSQQVQAAAAPVFNGTVKPLGLPVMNFANPLEKRGRAAAARTSTEPVAVASNGVRPLGPTPPLFPRS